MADQVFTIGSGRSGTKSMAVVLGTVYKNSFHEYSQLISERQRTYLHMSYAGPRLKAKIRQYRKMGEFHDSDNCNTVFIHHLCKAFPNAKILLPIGSPISFIRAHRAWGIMGLSDKNINTRMFPTDNKWAAWPIVAKLAWLWGKRNLEAIKRADRKRLLVFRTNNISNELSKIFNFIGKPLNDKAISLAQTKHNKLDLNSDNIVVAENEIAYHRQQIDQIVGEFKRAIGRFTRVFN